MSSNLLSAQPGRDVLGIEDGFDGRGVKEAALLTCRLWAVAMAQVYPNLPWGRGTVEAVVERTGQEVSFDRRLREIDPGDFACLNDHEVKGRSKDYCQPCALRVLGFSDRNGEGLGQFHARPTDTVRELFLDNRGDRGRVAVACHGGFINVALWVLFGNELAGFTRLRLANTTVKPVRSAFHAAVTLPVNDTSRSAPLAA